MKCIPYMWDDVGSQNIAPKMADLCSKFVWFSKSVPTQSPGFLPLVGWSVVTLCILHGGQIFFSKRNFRFFSLNKRKIIKSNSMTKVPCNIFCFEASFSRYWPFFGRKFDLIKNIYNFLRISKKLILEMYLYNN